MRVSIAHFDTFAENRQTHGMNPRMRPLQIGAPQE
jgi:hypothetical protein